MFHKPSEIATKFLSDVITTSKRATGLISPTLTFNAFVRMSRGEKSANHQTKSTVINVCISARCLTGESPKHIAMTRSHP